MKYFNFLLISNPQPQPWTSCRYLLLVLLLLAFAACARGRVPGATGSAKVAAPQPDTLLVVARDGSGDFRYLQDAINSIRAFSPVRIHVFIRKGIYKEKVQIPAWLTNITIKGESPDSTILTYDDHAGRGKMGTFDTYTLRIEGNNINIENLTIANTAGPVGQAVALHAEGDRLVFRNCRLLGNQDTLFASGEGSRQYYVNCYIEGTTDFIFGPATALFENCHIHSKKDSYITAASTPHWVMWGYVFKDCLLTADAGVTQVYLGRPWRDHAKTVFINSRLGAHIRPEGWHNWSRPEAEKTVFYAEWGNKGPGAAAAARVPWSRALSAKEAALYTAEIIFGKDAEAAAEAASEGKKWYER